MGLNSFLEAMVRKINDWNMKISEKMLKDNKRKELEKDE